eukprot:TRINITY_DN110568_c0_g1_i1.p1 TRINITY_DN110568_c0_g1~~TRINITY_DN110568_c0_g1_i1.p1  ORF type:complete len:324 (+),score=54.21 TRINITY_DN110568_c0_g1_i1:56-973(+)
MAAGGRTNGAVRSGISNVTSQPTLPSVSSVQPLRRSMSMTSAQKQSACGRWQETLQKRLGTPGQPPGRDVLPSLYDRRRGYGQEDAAALREVSGASKSLPPSTVGPSASVIAWFAQYQCTGCSRIPTQLDAKFCFFCGEALPLPRVSGAVTGGEGSRLANNLGEVAAAAALQAAGLIGNSGGGAGGGGGSHAATEQPHQQQPQPQRQSQQQKQQLRSSASAPAAASAPTQGQQGHSPKRGRRTRGYRESRPGDQHAKPRPPHTKGYAAIASAALVAQAQHQKELPWNARESQVAVWLGNIKPRRP